MSGPAADPGHRRRYNQPARGEWVDLPVLEEPVLPAYPMAWNRRDQRENTVPKRTWDYWRKDPVTTQWAPGDVALVLELGERYWLLKDDTRLKMLTYLGLNAKGRRDLRWRTVAETESAKRAARTVAEIRKLRIVAEDKPDQKAG